MKRWLSLGLAVFLALPAANAAAQAAQDPHAGLSGMGEPARDRSEPAADLPAGTIEAQIVDAQGTPVPEVEVRLGIMFQSIAEGESKSQRLGRADGEGKVRFSGLETGSNYSYRVTTKSGPAEYASPPFQLRAESGHRVLLHSYPVTRDIKSSMIAMRGFVYIEPRDDVFQFEVLFRVFNVGRNTWVPSETYMRLPAGFKAFKATESMADTGFELDETRGARLVGTYSPGQHDVSFRFQVPSQNESSVSFRIGMLPHVAEIRVIAEAAQNMKLDIDGFEPPQTATNQTGERVLVTRRVMQRGEPELKGFDILITGLPVPGPGRWIAVFIAGALALAGVGAARGWFAALTARQKVATQDIVQAREILLSELVALESARKAEQIGPGAYDRARRLLVDSLARIGAAPPAPRPQRRKTRRSRRAASDPQPEEKLGKTLRKSSSPSRDKTTGERDRAEVEDKAADGS